MNTTYVIVTEIEISAIADKFYLICERCWWNAEFITGFDGKSLITTSFQPSSPVIFVILEVTTCAATVPAYAISNSTQIVIRCELCTAIQKLKILDFAVTGANRLKNWRETDLLHRSVHN